MFCVEAPICSCSGFRGAASESFKFAQLKCLYTSLSLKASKRKVLPRKHKSPRASSSYPVTNYIEEVKQLRLCTRTFNLNHHLQASGSFLLPVRPSLLPGCLLITICIRKQPVCIKSRTLNPATS
jgi:hypothetical protein